MKRMIPASYQALVIRNHEAVRCLGDIRRWPAVYPILSHRMFSEASVTTFVFFYIFDLQCQY